MSETKAPIEIFCSYAHKDEALMQELKAHLSGLQYQGRISTWYDRQIIPGTNWAEAIDTHLETASLILLLISADFLHSKYCSHIEMQRALQRHAANQARVIPIILRPVDWKGLPFEHLQVLPTDAKPITSSSWDSHDEAFLDVATGIRRALDDLSSYTDSVSPTQLPTIWNVPYPRNPFFTGRDDLLTRLHTQLQAGQTTALAQHPQAISGLGGIGKTQLAVEYAYRHHQEYQAILWVHAENQETLIASYNAIATLLSLPQREASEQKIMIDAVKQWLQTHHNWLLILDNADDLDLIPSFLPPVPAGHILLTTRAWDMQRLAQRIEVETLPLEQGTLFLLRRSALIAPNAPLSQVRPEDREIAQQIVQELGALPLALDQAGAYLEATSMSLSQYQHLYQRHRHLLLRERRARVPDHPEPVATTWSLSFQRIEKKNATAADLLRLCAYLAPDAIPETIITKGAPHLGPRLKSIASDPLLLNQTIEALRAYSLLQRNPQTQCLSIHRLVQAVLQDSMTTKAQKQWKQRIVRAVNASRPDVRDIAQWPACEQWLPHAQTCATWIQQEDMTFPEAALMLNDTAYYLDDRARYAEAERLYKQALSIYERQLGEEHPNAPVSMNNLAGLYQDQGKYAEAEELCERALAIYMKTNGEEHPGTALSMNNLAGLYESQGKYTEAGALCKRALAICEKQLGEEHPQTAMSLHNLAHVCAVQGKYAEAEGLYERAISVDTKVYGEDHPEVATDLHNLANLYESQGRNSEAEQLYKRALSIRERFLGSQHPYTQNTRSLYASLLRAMGRDEEADALGAE